MIRIRDLVLFPPLDQGSGIEEKNPGSRMNIPDNFFESLETLFMIKILKFFDADPG
jgi:hypothetical protein